MNITNNDKVLIWGGPYVTVLTRSAIEHLLVHFPDSSSCTQRPAILKAPDWIYHGAVSQCDSSRAVVVTAHNEVLPLHISPGGGDGGYDEGWLAFGKLRAPRTSRPILYSAQVRWTGEDEVLVAAGTVFGEIVVWRCQGLIVHEDDEEEDESDRGVEVLFVFTGHEGSIFGIDISPEIPIVVDSEKDEESAEVRRAAVKRLLASCSDDRTIRIWDITGATTPQDEKQESVAEKRERENRRHHFTEARETGFGENIPSLEASASHVSSKPLAMAMGHVSRIWNVRFTPPTPGEGAGANLGDDNLVLYSFGEDATAQKWRLDLKDALRRQQQQQREENGPASAGGATLTHQAILLRHSGKQVWSSAVLGSGDRTLVATGGSDGKIHLVEDVEGGYPGSVMLTVSGSEVSRRFPSPSAGIDVQTQDHERAKEAQEQEQEQEEETISTPPPESKATTKKRKTKTKKDPKEEEPFQMYAILSRTSFLATTPMGRIFKGSLTGAASVQWEEFPLDQTIRDDLRQYQIVRELKGSGKALLASTTGKLYLYNDDADSLSSIRQVYQMPGKIADVFPLPSGDALPDLGVSVVEWSSSDIVPIIVTTMGNPQIMRLLLLDTTMGAAAATIRQEHTIELDKGFIVTAAGCCRGYLVFGSRNGALAVYKASRSPTTEDLQFQQVTRVDRPLTKDSVSSIIPLPSKTSSPASPCPYFLTTSRDGRYRIYELTTTSQVQVHLRHEAVPPLGPVIEGAFFTTPTDDNQQPELILAGFRSQDFIVWNETRQVELAKVECGGAYRSFTYHVEDKTHDNENRSSSSRDVTFVWTRASRTCIYSYSSSSREERGEQALQQQRRVNGNANAAGITTLKSGGHGREIKAVAAWGDLLATGAEDTTLRIWRCRPSNHRQQHHPTSSSTTRLDCLAVVEKHTTGIQHLQWVGSSSKSGGDGPSPSPCPSPSPQTLYLVSSSGNEELFIWRVCPALPDSAFGGLTIVCEGVYSDKTRDGDLRIMGFDVRALNHQNATKEGKEEEEGKLTLCLSLVLSNSTLRTYRYSKIGGFVLLAEGRYTGACLLQIRHLHLGRTILSTTTPAEIHVVTASTDGTIALWKAKIPLSRPDKTSSVAPLPSYSSDETDKQTPPAKGGEYEYTLVEAARLHQSSIKTLDLLLIPSSYPKPGQSSSLSLSSSLSALSSSSSSYLLVTGGDDNALGFAHLHLTYPPPQQKSTEKKNQHCFTIARRALVNGAHAAAITGLAITTSLSQNTPLPSSSLSPPSQFVVNVCTASTDQRVKSWRINLSLNLNPTPTTTANNNGSNTEMLVQKIALVANRYSSVADCGDLEVFEGDRDYENRGRRGGGERRVVVAGVGMEVWKV